jgi:hypothetical protein
MSSNSNPHNDFFGNLVAANKAELRAAWKEGFFDKDRELKEEAKKRKQ